MAQQNIHITENHEQTVQNAQIVPVYTEKESIKLLDYVPYVGSEAICSDNSSEYEDDFSLAPSIILDDEPEAHRDSYDRIKTYTKSS